MDYELFLPSQLIGIRAVSCLRRADVKRLSWGVLSFSSEKWLSFSSGERHGKVQSHGKKRVNFLRNSIY